jgi:hypothetical protein
MAKKVHEYTFLVVLDDGADTIIEKKYVKIKRTCPFIAQDYLKKKYKFPYFVEREK